jgi:hypothetical protein
METSLFIYNVEYQNEMANMKYKKGKCNFDGIFGKAPKVFRL